MDRRCWDRIIAALQGKETLAHVLGLIDVREVVGREALPFQSGNDPVPRLDPIVAVGDAAFELLVALDRKVLHNETLELPCRLRPIPCAVQGLDEESLEFLRRSAEPANVGESDSAPAELDRAAIVSCGHRLVDGQFPDVAQVEVRIDIAASGILVAESGQESRGYEGAPLRVVVPAPLR